MSEEQIRFFLTENIDYFVTNDLIISCFRKIGWMIVKGLNSLIEYAQILYNATFGMVDITRYAEVESFLSEYSVLLQAVMALSLVALGYMLIFGKEKRHDLLTSVLIFAVVVTSSSYLFTTMGSFAVLFKDAVITGSGVADGYTLVNQNLYDLKYIDAQIGLENMNETNLPQYDSLTEQDIKMINVTDTLADDEDGLSGAAKDILGKQIVYDRVGGVLLDVNKGVLNTGIGSTYYYRYQFHYARYYLNAAAMLLIYFGLSYVNIKIILELLRSRVFLTLFSADLSSKKKAVRILESIRDGFYALCFTAVELRLYLIVTDYINQMDIPALARSIIVLMVAFAVIDGSSLAEKITGVDAGLGSAMHGLMGAAHMARGAVMFGMQAKQLSMLKNLGRDSGETPGEDSGSRSGGSNMPEEAANSESNRMENMQTDQNADVQAEQNSNMQTDEGGNMQTDNLSNAEGDQSTDIQEENPSNMSEAVSESYGENEPEGQNMQESGGDGTTAEQNFARMDEALDTGAEKNEMEGPAKEASAGEGNMFERWEKNQSASQENEAGKAEENFGEKGEISGQTRNDPGRNAEIPEHPEEHKTFEVPERSMNHPSGTQDMPHNMEMPKEQKLSAGMHGRVNPSNMEAERSSGMSEDAGRTTYAGRNGGSESMMSGRGENGSAGHSQINKKEK